MRETKTLLGAFNDEKHITMRVKDDVQWDRYARATRELNSAVQDLIDEFEGVPYPIPTDEDYDEKTQKFIVDTYSLERLRHAKQEFERASLTLDIL